MLLTIADFPPTDDIASLNGAIAFAQALAEGVMGANRPLAPTEYTEVIDISNTGRGYLAYLPILITPTPVVKIRGETRDRWDRWQHYSEWTSLAPNRYEIDSQGEIIVTSLDADYIRFSNVRHVPNMGRRSLELKVTYTSGFDFFSQSSEVQSIKASLIALTNQIGNVALRAGVKRFKIDDLGHETEYLTGTESQIFGTSSSGSLSGLSLLLANFQKYRPRSYSFA